MTFQKGPIYILVIIYTNDECLVVDKIYFILDLLTLLLIVILRVVFSVSDGEKLYSKKNRQEWSIEILKMPVNAVLKKINGAE